MASFIFSWFYLGSLCLATLVYLLVGGTNSNYIEIKIIESPVVAVDYISESGQD